MEIDHRKYYPILISGLAIFVAQILQGILWYLMMAGSQKMQIPMTGIIWVLLPGFLAVLGGGAFQGRFLPNLNIRTVVLTGCINALSPALFQVVFSPDRFGWVTDPGTLLTIVSSVLIWYAGHQAGRISLDKHPSPTFDRMLRNITIGAVVVLIGLYGFVWISLRFSESYKIAREIHLPAPPDTDEVVSDFMTPEILTAKRFRTVIMPDDITLYMYYETEFAGRNYQNITDEFQAWNPGEWQIRNHDSGDRIHEYRITGAHWLESQGKVMISLLLQAEKENPEADWSETPWKVAGIIATRSYVKPGSVEPGSGSTPALRSDEAVETILQESTVTSQEPED